MLGPFAAKMISDLVMETPCHPMIKNFSIGRFQTAIGASKL